MGKFSLPKPDAEYLLSEEAATEQLMVVLKHYSIDIEAQPDRRSQKALEAVCNRLVRAYRAGSLENVRDGNALKIKQHLRIPPGEVKELVWDRMTAKAKLATDGFPEDDRYARAYALAASLTGLPVGAIEKLEGADLSTAEDLGVLFLLG
jgi:hypothetical protein